MSNTIKILCGIPSDIGVFEDKRTKAKSIAIPFDYPSGQNGIIILTKMTKLPWKPSEEVKSITIELAYDDQTT